MCPKTTCVKTDARDPFINEPRVMSCRDGPIPVAAAGKQKFLGLLAEDLHILINRLTCILGHFESNRLTCLLLANCCALDRVSVRCNVLYFQANNIAAAQLTVDGEVEHRKLATAAFDL